MDNNEQKKHLFRELQDIDSQIALLKDKKERLLFQTVSLNNQPSAAKDSFSENNSIIAAKKSIDKLSSPSEKIALFRSLFRGRADVYARWWKSQKTGRSGYSFVCKNEWVPKICDKPMIKCSNCPNREFIPIDNEVIRKHLRGVHLIGIYPMLKNENCHLLVADFDKEDWMENVFSFNETCLQEGVSVAIERSRSGNGAHAWIFF